MTPHCHPPYPPDSQAAAEKEGARKKAEEDQAKEQVNVKPFCFSGLVQITRANGHLEPDCSRREVGGEGQLRCKEWGAPSTNKKNECS